MALVVESTANGNTTGGTLTIAKPSGLTAGDLMISCISSARSTASTNPTISTASGWTLAINGNDATGATGNIQYKIADAGDVSASDFSWTITGGDRTMGAIMRVTGHASPNIVAGSSSAGTSSAANDNLINISLSLTPNTEPCLVVFAFSVAQTTSGTTTGEMSGYTSTPTMTFTELYDYNTVSGTAQAGVAGAYGVYTATTTQISNITVTLAGSYDNHNVVVAAFRPNFPSSGTNALHTVSPVTFSQNGYSGSVGTNALLSVSPTLPTQSGTGTEPTVWTLTAKP